MALRCGLFVLAVVLAVTGMATTEVDGARAQSEAVNQQASGNPQGLGAPAILPAQPPATNAPAPDKDDVSVDLSPGYARILFRFRQPTQINAAIADGVLLIRLNRALGVSAETLTGKLGAYAGVGRRDANGLTYRIALAGPVTLHNTARGLQAAVDLVPEGYAGTAPPDFSAPPPPPKEALPDPNHLPALKVRVGEYQNFTRLVFDWPAQIAYGAQGQPGRVTLRFQSAAKPDFSMLESRKPAWVKNANWHLDGTAIVVGFETDPESRIHDFRDGNKIVVDVLAPRTDASVYVASVAAKDKPVPGPAKDAAKPPQTAAPPAKAPNAGGVVVFQTPAAAGPAPSAELTRDGATLHFPAQRGKAVAVFTRGETLWIVLDGHPAIDAPTLLAPMANLLAKAEADQQDGAAILKLVMKAPLLASVSDDDTALNVVLSAGAATPPEAIAFTRAGADRKLALAASLPGAVRAIELADLDAGDRIVAVPGRQGRGVLTPRRFLEMEALASAAGIAVVPHADDLAAEIRDETVSFSRSEGLALSSASGVAPEPVVQAPANPEGAGFVDFAQWGRGDGNGGGDDVYAAQRRLRASVARLPESAVNKTRLQLARYLLAHDLAPEALGEVQLMQAADQKLANDPGLEAMKGVAQTMMARYADARLTLSAGPLGNDPHAALWRGMAETKLGDFADARRDLAASQSVLRLYPARWQIRARLARAETGLAQGDLASASDALDQLPRDLSPRDSVEARFLAAELLAAQGHVNEALARLTALEKTDYAPIAARATYARVDIALGTGKLKHDAAIETLERLRFRWRGDDLELKTLRRLGGLYFADSRWREGLETLRVAAQNFPNSDLARQAQDDMRKAFTDLFLGAKADAMKPVDALALFYDFIELTPIGRDGDEMIRRLSDRLVAVDLLAPAEVLLDHQVSQRLDGVARASVATKLATIYLLDHKPQDALRVINQSRETRLPDDMNQERRLLEARALAGVKQYDAAVDLVADDESPEAKRLRADIYWESGNWKIAGDKTEEFLGDRWNADGPLSDAERGEVMRSAVAYSLGGDEAGLERLRARYGAKMEASPDAKSFAVVTEKIERQGVAFRDLAKTIASVDTLQAFMADFKKQGAAPGKTASN